VEAAVNDAACPACGYDGEFLAFAGPVDLEVRA
jgi:hypothetical protein